MKALYCSITASLPMLKLFEKRPFSLNQFLTSCEGYVPDKDLEILKRLQLCPEEDSSASFSRNTLAGKYTAWEKALRDSIRKIRAAKLGGEFSAGCPGMFFYDTDAARAAARAYAASNALEREKMLDMFRWTKIEELEQSNQTRFNFDTVCGFCLKLRIMEKWDVRSEGEPEENLTSAALAVQKS